MLRILVCGEGKHDIGTSTTLSNIIEEEGWLQALLRKLIDTEVEIVAISRRRLPRQRQKHFQPRPQGHGEKALASKIRAKSGGYDLIVFMADADSRDQRDWRRVRAEILGGFARISGVANVPCVPMSTSESWLLADEHAWQKIGLADLALLPTKPENIWGERKDPQSNHPHQFFQRVCIGAKVSDSRETRFQLMDFSNLETLRSTCPTSFAAFAEDTQSALVAISSP